MRSFWEIYHFINQSLVSPSETQADCTCWKDSSGKFPLEFYIKWTLFPSSKTISVVIIIIVWLVSFRIYKVFSFFMITRN